MTNRAKRTLILAIVLIVAISTVLVGCSGKPLDTPELVFDSVRGIVNWDAVSDAAHYKVEYKDKISIVDQPHFVLKERGKYSVTVTAIAGDKKHTNSKPSTIDVLYSTIIEAPKVRFSRYYGGNIRYIIDNYDEFASLYVITVNGKPYEVKTNRGVIETNLGEGKYTVSIQAKGDNIITRDSDVVSQDVVIKPVERFTAEYEAKVGGGDFAFKLKNVKDIESIYVDFFEVDKTNYNNPALDGGMLVIKESVLTNHVGDAPARVEVNFKDGDAILIEVTIIDNRQANFGDTEYVTVHIGHDAYIDFEIFRNELVSIELERVDGTRVLLKEGEDYDISYNLLRASVIVHSPNAEADKALTFTFRRNGTTYTKSIKYYFQDALPHVTTTHFTYNKGYASRSDINVRYTSATGKVTGVRLDYALDASDYMVDDKLGQILVKSSYLDKFPVGSIITGRVYFGSEYDTFTVHVIDVEGMIPATFSDSEYVYLTHSTSGSLELNVNGDFSLSDVSLDGIRLDRNDYTFENVETRKYIAIKRDVMMGLSSGLHEVRAHLKGATTYDIVTNVLVEAKDLTPTNIKESADNSYPYISVTYQPVSEDTTSTLVNKRTGKKYYNKPGEARISVPYSDMEVGDKYTITHTRNGESKTSAEIEYKANDVKQYEKYYSAQFTWGGDHYDSVITSDEEFETLLHYAIMQVSKMRAYGMNTDPSDTMLWSKAQRAQYEYTIKIYTPYIIYDRETYIGTITSLIKKYAKTYKEPTKIDFYILSDNYNECSLSLRVNSTNVPYMADNKEHPVTPTRYKVGKEMQYKTDKPRSPGFDDFKINKWTKTQKVYLADELYYAIEDGARPVPIEGSPAEEMYNLIKDVMREICDDSMSDAEKYRAIYEWIVHNVTYDKATQQYESKLGSANYYKIYPRRCFYLEGVFVDKVAVCNGLAKAVVVMAGIEGINSMKVVGGSSGGRHAWVKARLDGIWYNSDPTWGSMTLDNEPKVDGKVAEGVNHVFTLMSDIPFNWKNVHREEARFGNVVANIDYDYFANTRLSMDDKAVNTAIVSTKGDAIALAEANKSFAMTKNIISIAYVNNATDQTFSPVEVMRAELSRLTGKSWTYVDSVNKQIVSDNTTKKYMLATFRCA